MAIAKHVLECEPTSVGWLTIEDTSGKVWRYDRTEESAPNDQPHVDWGLAGGGFTVKLTRRDDGDALLQQDEPGLPKRIIVEILQGPNMPMMSPVIGGYQGRFVYVLADEEKAP